MRSPELEVYALTAVTDADAAEIGRLMHVLDPAFSAEPNPDFLRTIVETPTMDELVAREGRTLPILGCLTISTVVEPAIKYGYVGGVVVAPEAQGKGVGQALMEGVDEWALTHGLASVELQTEAERESAIRLYERTGYKRVTDGVDVTRGIMFVKHFK